MSTTASHIRKHESALIEELRSGFLLCYVAQKPFAQDCQVASVSSDHPTVCGSALGNGNPFVDDAAQACCCSCVTPTAKPSAILPTASFDFS